MATIQKVINSTSISYRVFIRKRGFKTLSKTFPTQKIAKEFALRMESDATAMLSIGGISSKTSFNNLVDEYLLKEYKGSRPKEQYKKLCYWMEILGKKLIIDITKNDISTGLELLPNDFSNATINRYKAAIGVVLSYACRTFDLPENPVRQIPSLPENNERTRFLSEAERTRLFKACRASHWDKLYLIVLLAITTGARKGELTKLRWNDIDFDRRTAYVATTKNGQPKATYNLTRDSVVFEKTQQAKWMLINCITGRVDINELNASDSLKMIFYKGLRSDDLGNFSASNKRAKDRLKKWSEQPVLSMNDIEGNKSRVLTTSAINTDNISIASKIKWFLSTQ